MSWLCRWHSLCHGLYLWCRIMREESPGSIGQSTSENRSCRWRQVRAEENDRHHVLCLARVRRWCKRPPVGRWLSSCARWMLQVHVNHRLRVVRPIRWRVERLSRRVTCGVDKWQAPIVGENRHGDRTRLIGTLLSLFFDVRNPEFKVMLCWQRIVITFFQNDVYNK